MTFPITIPAETVTRQYAQIQDEVAAAIAEVLPTGKYVLGPNLQAFEQEFAAYCGTSYSTGISNGTEALHLALLACGVGPGDEVITVPNTYIATVFAISYTGATPVFVDIDPNTYNIDITKIEERITPRTKAIVPVHMYGQIADMDPLLEIAQAHRLYVIEDAAHAHGALYKGRRAGSLGHVGCFSFYPTKVLGCFGDGGMTTTNDPELNDRIRVLRYMGQHTKYNHEVIGYQQRLDELQAAILRVKLRYLEEWIERRIHLAQCYERLLADLPVVTPVVAPNHRHVFYLYNIRVPHRDELQRFLTERGIGTHVVYPLAAPLQPAYRHLGYSEGDFPISDSQVGEILCLPMFPELTEDEVEQVASAIREFFTEHVAAAEQV